MPSRSAPLTSTAPRRGCSAPSARTTRASTCSRTPPWSRTSTLTGSRASLGSPLAPPPPIHGGTDAILALPARGGGRVAVHPLHFALLTRDPQVREFQVIQDGPALRILIVPSPAVAEGDDRPETRLTQAVIQQLLRLGVHDPHITVERRQ